MCKERTKEAKEYIPIAVCPDCIWDGLQIDPRTNVPDYPVIESFCSIHLIIRGELSLNQDK